MTSRGRATVPGRMRIQKLLADAGLGSRRALERRIEAGEVSLNGRPARLGEQAGAGDTVALDGQEWKVVAESPRFRTLVYNKPLGEVTTRSDPQGRPTVFDRLPPLREGRWVAIGRLDINTSGLLVLTTDGDLAHAMMHPGNRVDREYACRILGEAGPEALEALRQGVELEDGPARFSDIVASGGSGQNRWYHVTLLEGRNREVRRLWAAQGFTVSRLKRVRYGAVFLPKRLRMGEYRELSQADHQVLREDVGLAAPAPRLALKSTRRPRGKPPSRKRATRPERRPRRRP